MNKALPIILAVLISAAVFGGVGYWLGTQKAEKTAATATATITTTTTASTTATVNTTGWKTYTNDEYGFSFKYPSTWESQDLSQYVDNAASIKVGLIDPATKDAKTSSQAKNIFIKIYPKTDDSSLSDWLTSKYKLSDTELENYTVGKAITLGGVSGYFSNISCCGAFDNSYAVEKGDNVYMLGSDSSETISMLSQIASTFRFTK